MYDSEGAKIRLSDKTLCMEAVQANGSLRHYDVHNLYGHVQSQVTLRCVSSKPILGNTVPLVFMKIRYV